MSDVILINPNYGKDLYSEHVVSLHPPLGLAYLASYLRNRGISVGIIEANAFKMSNEQITEKIAESQTKIVGIGAVTSTAEAAFGLCSKIKEEIPSIKIVMGGVHISCLTEESLSQCPAIDYAVVGEGEKILYNLVVALKKNKSVNRIKGIAFINKNKKFIRNSPEKLIENLDELPFPARDLLPIELYKPGSEFDLGFNGMEYGEVISSRGCPNKCVYCSSAHFWKIIRMRSVENVMEEIKQLKESGVRHISFLDDTFTISEAFIINICERIKPLNLKWDCYVRVNNITEKMVKSMKESGCIGVRIGFESGNDEILRKIKKNTSIEQARNAMKLFKKYDLKTMGFFMIGLTEDNEKTIEETINFAIELNPYFASFAITTPFPGTEMFEEYLKRGWMPKDLNLHNLELHSSDLTRTETLNPQQVIKYYNKAQKKFYLRPRYWGSISVYLAKHPREIIKYCSRLFMRFGLKK